MVTVLEQVDQEPGQSSRFIGARFQQIEELRIVTEELLDGKHGTGASKKTMGNGKNGEWLRRMLLTAFTRCDQLEETALVEPSLPPTGTTQIGIRGDK